MKPGVAIGIGLLAVGAGIGVWLAFFRKGVNGTTPIQKLTGGSTTAAALATPEAQTLHTPNPPATRPAVPATPVAKTLSLTLDDHIGEMIGAVNDNTAVYSDDGSYTLFKKFMSGERIGTLGKNENNGYHQVTDVVGGSGNYTISDQFLKYMFNLA